MARVRPARLEKYHVLRSWIYVEPALYIKNIWRGAGPDSPGNKIRPDGFLPLRHGKVVGLPV